MRRNRGQGNYRGQTRQFSDSLRPLSAPYGVRPNHQPPALVYPVLTRGRCETSSPFSPINLHRNPVSKLQAGCTSTIEDTSCTFWGVRISSVAEFVVEVKATLSLPCKIQKSLFDSGEKSLFPAEITESIEKNLVWCLIIFAFLRISWQKIIIELKISVPSACSVVRLTFFSRALFYQMKIRCHHTRSTF